MNFIHKNFQYQYIKFRLNFFLSWCKKENTKFIKILIFFFIFIKENNSGIFSERGILLQLKSSVDYKQANTFTRGDYSYRLCDSVSWIVSPMSWASRRYRWTTLPGPFREVRKPRETSSRWRMTSNILDKCRIIRSRPSVSSLALRASAVR